MTLMQNFKNFCDNSTIHGINFWITTKSLVTKLLWVFVVLLGIGSACFMIWNNFQTWAANPVVVSVVQVPIEQAPYPSVTICPLESTPFGGVEMDIDQAYGRSSSIRLEVTKVIELFLLSLANQKWSVQAEIKDPCAETFCTSLLNSNDPSCTDSNNEFRIFLSRYYAFQNSSGANFDVPLFLRSEINSLFQESERKNPESRTLPLRDIFIENRNCFQLYFFSNFFSEIEGFLSLKNIEYSFKPGTILAWIYSQAEEFDEDISNQIRYEVLRILDPTKIPEVSSRSRFGTDDDIFIPEMVKILKGENESNDRSNTQGIEFSDDLYKIMKYSLSPTQVFMSQDGKINSKPGIPFCLFASSDKEGKKIGRYPERFCSSMQPVINEDGLCYSYNSVNFGLEPGFNYTENLANIPGVGHKKGLTLIVDSHMIKNRALSVKREHKGYKVIVTVPGAIAAKVSFIVEPDFPGEHSFYLHGIHYIVASPDVVEWNKDARVCYFPDGKKLSFYNYYLQDNCLQECKLKKVTQQCTCTPWFLKQKELPICDDRGMKCFNNLLSNYQDDLKDRITCDCKNDCEMVHFFYSMRQEGYNKKWFDAQGQEGYLANYLLDPDRVFIEPLTHNLTKLMYGMDDVQIAETRFKRDIAILNFFFDTPIISNFKLEMKVTIFDQISAIGGTLGLFAGISLISMFEIIYWILKASMEMVFSVLSGSNSSKKSPVSKISPVGFRQPFSTASFQS